MSVTITDPSKETNSNMDFGSVLIKMGIKAQTRVFLLIYPSLYPREMQSFPAHTWLTRGHTQGFILNGHNLTYILSLENCKHRWTQSQQVTLGQAAATNKAKSLCWALFVNPGEPEGSGCLWSHFYRALNSCAHTVIANCSIEGNLLAFC